MELAIIVKRIKRSNTIRPYEQLLSSLAVADLLTGLFLVILKVNKLVSDPSSTDEALVIDIVFCLVLTTVMISVANLATICLDRMMAVKCPFLYRTQVSTKRTWATVIGQWILAWALIPIPILAGKLHWVDVGSMAKIYGKIIAWFLLVVGATCALAYIEICRAVYNRPRIQSIAQRQQQSNGSSRQNRERKTNLTVLVTCVLVVCAYLVFTTPFAVRILKGKKPLNEYSGIMLFSNSIVNPLIYYFKGFWERKVEIPTFPKKMVRVKMAARSQNVPREN
eukprot:gene12742-14048_t